MNTRGESTRIGRIERTRSGRLRVHTDRQPEPFEDARIARCFPWSLPDTYISVRDKDGKEIALLKSLDVLDPDSRRIVEDEIRQKIFNPRIERIIEHKNEFGVISVTADTDRGRVTFQMRSRDDIRMLSPGRALLRDADGNTYEISSFDDLDPASRKLLMEYF